MQIFQFLVGEKKMMCTTPHHAPFSKNKNETKSRRYLVHLQPLEIRHLENGQTHLSLSALGGVSRKCQAHLWGKAERTNCRGVYPRGKRGPRRFGPCAGCGRRCVHVGTGPSVPSWGVPQRHANAIYHTLTTPSDTSETSKSFGGTCIFHRSTRLP